LTAQNTTSERFIAHVNERGGPVLLADMFIRTKCYRGRHVLAQGATKGNLDYDTLIALSSRRDVGLRPGLYLDVAWLLQLARLIALQNGPAGLDAAEALFELARVTHGLGVFDMDTGALYAQVLLRQGRLDRLSEIMRHLELSRAYQWSLQVDMSNPFLASSIDDDRWRKLFNETFSTGGLESVSLTGDGSAPFDRLTATAATATDSGEMVTVIMSAFRPNQSIRTAVRSITAQSWSNLELLIVDDGSPTEYKDLLRDVAAMDVRIRLLTAPRNSGTYQARNYALEYARGEFVTFQDADDWSHPRRLELQIEALCSSGALATSSWAVRAFPDLSVTFIGYPPNRLNASSLLFRRKPVLELLGGFDPVRKSADIEFRARLAAAALGSLHDLPESKPLAITQLRSQSLSRADATPGWMRWDRLAYRDAYTLWHTRIRSGLAAARLDTDTSTRSFPIPDGSWASGQRAGAKKRYDILVYNDWRRGKGPQYDAIDEIHDMLDRGLRVAIAHAETPEPPSRRREPKAMTVQELINRAAVDFVHVEQDIEVDLVLVRDPATLQFLPGVESALRAGQVVILYDHVGQTGEYGAYYRFADCAHHAERLFSRRPRWVARSSQSRDFLSAHLDLADIGDIDLPVPLRLDRFRNSRRRPSSPRPVIGRHLTDHWSQWPATAVDLLGAYPDDDRFDVRIMGGTSTPRRVLQAPLIPPNWVSFGPDQLPTHAFLAQLDFFVYFHHPQLDTSVLREPLEAMASGCVVVLQQDLEGEYGDSAVYCQPSEVPELVLELHNEPVRYAQQQHRGFAYVQNTQRSNVFVDRLKSLSRPHSKTPARASIAI
jgi:O-antigen biosynthesis protein